MEGEKEIGQKSTFVIIFIITSVTVAFPKDVSTKTDGEEQRETLEKAEGLRFQVEEDPLAQVAEGIKLTKQRVH